MGYQAEIESSLCSHPKSGILSYSRMNTASRSKEAGYYPSVYDAGKASLGILNSVLGHQNMRTWMGPSGRVPS